MILLAIQVAGLRSRELSDTSFFIFCMRLYIQERKKLIPQFWLGMVRFAQTCIDVCQTHMGFWCV